MSPRARRFMLALALLSTYWSITPLLEDVERQDDDDLPPYDDNGDLRGARDQRWRRVAWQINGGPVDGRLVTDDNLDETLREWSHGGYSPLYVRSDDG